jgi:hypothetical protein
MAKEFLEYVSCATPTLAHKPIVRCSNLSCVANILASYWQEIDMADINKPQDVRQPQAQSDAAIRRSAEAVQQGGHATADALRQNAEVGADVARRGSEAGADAMRRASEAASETARRGAQAVADAQRQIAQDAAQRFEEVSRKVAEATKGTTENVRQLMALPNAAEGGLRDMQQGVTGLVEGVVQTNLRARRSCSAWPTRPPSWSCSSASPASTRTPCCGTAPRWSAPCAAPPTRRCARWSSRSSGSSASRPTRTRARRASRPRRSERHARPARVQA